MVQQLVILWLRAVAVAVRVVQQRLLEMVFLAVLVGAQPITEQVVLVYQVKVMRVLLEVKQTTMVVLEAVVQEQSV
jgi:hypothetical protein